VKIDAESGDDALKIDPLVGYDLARLEADAMRDDSGWRFGCGTYA